MLRWLNKAGEGLANKVLLEWALDMLRSPEDWRWLWSPEATPTPSSFPTPPSHLPLSPYNASNVNPWNTYALSAPNMYAYSADESLLDTPNRPAPCIPAQSVESLVMWVPLAQLQPQLAHHLSLPKWATWDNLESESQGYERGNVTVVDALTSFSPFSSADCTLYSHFSFNNFVTIAFRT